MRMRDLPDLITPLIEEHEWVEADAVCACGWWHSGSDYDHARHLARQIARVLNKKLCDYELEREPWL